MTAAAEARAKTGHDIFALPTWDVTIHKDVLEPVDDMMAELTKKYGPYEDRAAYLCKHDGTWKAVVAPTGSHTYPMVSRLDYFKAAGVDLMDLFPAGPRDQAKIDQEWTYDKFLVAAQKLHEAGHDFGNPIGPTSDSQDWLGPLFLSFGGQMVSPAGEITVDSEGHPPRARIHEEADPVHAAGRLRLGRRRQQPLDHLRHRLVHPEPALGLGRGGARPARGRRPALAPRHAGRAQGPLPRQPALHVGHLELLAEHPGGQGPAALPVAEGAGRGAGQGLARLRSAAAAGVLRQPGLGDREARPPARSTTIPGRGNEHAIVSGYPAPPAIAAQIYNQALVPNMVARVTQTGASFDDAIAWASDELEGYMRG